MISGTGGLLNDIRDRITPGATAIRFMNTLIRMAADQCQTLNPGRLPVILSGGVFQNRFLLHGLTAELERLGYMVYTHHRISTNDELSRTACHRLHKKENKACVWQYQ